MATNLILDTEKVLGNDCTQYNALTILNKKLGTPKSYATLNATLHRAIGIPAKVVDGYTLGFGNDPKSWEELDQQNYKRPCPWFCEDLRAAYCVFH